MNRKLVERSQTGVRMEKSLLKVLKGLAEYCEISMGDLLEAYRRLPEDNEEKSNTHSIYRIALNLALGRMELAMSDLDLVENTAQRTAFEVLIQAVRQPASITTLPNASSATEHLAQSYALQANHNLPAALESARAARVPDRE